MLLYLNRSSKYCICVDPQYQANKWLKKQEDLNDLILLSYGEVNMTKQLELGIKFGKPVLVENIGNKLDLMLHPICK
jgi:dynein heavy chain